ncbi:ANKRD50 [Symbiodinium sp. CCMP2456]|nr:ANKRD50 [Symbiodinium sp. CCMP2456]
MALLVSFLLIALAAGFRSKSDPALPWQEHRVSSAEELQELLGTVLAEANTAKASKEVAGDAEAQEDVLREHVAIIMKDWQRAGAGACHQQLGLLMNNLMFACESLHPKADWLLDYYDPVLLDKTCAESVSDIFALGDELVETLRVSRDAVASLDVDGKTLRRYQALSFLRSWLVKLTETRDHALLWAGFWDGDPENRTTMTKLSNFAKEIEHSTVHPTTFLGRAIEASGNLDACYKDPQTNALAANMWSIASMSFVLGMRERAQGTVIALVNKQVTGERNLSQSVLSTHEIPTVGLAAWGLGFWSPKVMVVDLMGTCDKTSPALQKRLLARLPSWAKSMTNWSLEAFATRSLLQWQCIDCSGECSLDEAFAEHVEMRVKAKEEQDRKDQELRQVVRPRFAALAAAELSKKEVNLAYKLMMAVKGWRQKTALMRHARVLDLKLRSTAQEVEVWRELEGPEKQRRVEQLLRENADPNPPDRLGHTALLYAVYEGNLKLVETLLHAGARLEAHDEDGNVPLIYAAGLGDLDLKVVEALLKAGAQVEAHGRTGETALIVAANHGLLQVVEALVKAGAQLEARDEFGRTALTCAAEAGHLKVVEGLVKVKAQLENRKDNGDTALMVAALHGRLKVVEALLMAGAQLEARNEKGNTGLALAAKEGHYEVVEAMVKAGAEVEARDEDGFTALLFAAKEGHYEVVEALMKARAQLEARNKDGETALMYAAENDHVQVVEALVEAGAQLEARHENGFTALMFAAGMGRVKAVEALLKAGCQVDVHNEEGFTALIWAALAGHLHVVEALLKAGAQPQARDADGKTALDHAQDFGYPQIADLLRKYSVAH